MSFTDLEDHNKKSNRHVIREVAEKKGVTENDPKKQWLKLPFNTAMVLIRIYSTEMKTMSTQKSVNKFSQLLSAQ